MESPMLWPGVMTRLMACPPTCGAAAAIITSKEFARKHGLDTRVRVRAQAMTTDTTATFEGGDMRALVGFSMTRAAAERAFKSAGIRPEAIDVVDMPDCLAQNALISYDEQGLRALAEAVLFVNTG